MDFDVSVKRCSLSGPVVVPKLQTVRLSTDSVLGSDSRRTKDLEAAAGPLKYTRHETRGLLPLE